MICFAAIAPHQPLLLPTVGEESDRKEVVKTISSLKILGDQFGMTKPEEIIISSPHKDWGFNVPLHFLAPEFEGEIEYFLTGYESPEKHFEQGKEFFRGLEKNKRYAVIASGDLSHCLKEDGPYGFQADGPKFAKALQEYLIGKNIKALFGLYDDFPEAIECGLRSFSYLLGMLEASGKDWHPKILSYEGPFGVGYLVARMI